MSFSTEQEEFWAGKFGNQYIERNTHERLLMPKVAMWSKMLSSAHGITSVLELGCNIGGNLLALNKLMPSLKLSGVEINEEAAKRASELEIAKITRGTILDPIEHDAVDLTFTAGVLIHINPDRLHDVYTNLFEVSRRYVLVAEYYNPTPTTISYRGSTDRLFKRDFAGELMDQFGLKLVDYGFIYKRDNWAPQDDITWFLMEK
ncbi:MAG: pseudaminic acid biosynthesis-associated methylase [Ruegeria sp.]